jgi:hypothetical protein
MGVLPSAVRRISTRILQGHFIACFYRTFLRFADFDCGERIGCRDARGCAARVDAVDHVLQFADIAVDALGREYFGRSTIAEEAQGLGATCEVEVDHGLLKDHGEGHAEPEAFSHDPAALG